MAVFLVVSMGAAMLVSSSSDDSDAGYVINSKETGIDYVKTGGSYVFTVTNDTDAIVYASWNLNNSSGTSQSNGSFSTEAHQTSDVSVTAPSTAGDYKFVVKFYSASTKADSEHIADKAKSLKVVEPVKITVTFENKSTTALKFDAYLQVKKDGDWKTEDGSTSTVSVTAKNTTTDTNGTGTYTYEYVVRDLDRTTTYRVHTDDPTAQTAVKGLDTEYNFYTSQNNYDLITWLLVIVLIILLIFIIWIYRKPVKNYGKPKARK